MTSAVRNGFTRRSVLGSALGLSLFASLSGQIQTAAATIEWKELEDGESPADRWDHTLSYDETSKQLVVFGGRDANFTALGDTWIYSFESRNWSQIESTGPDPRYGHAIAVDQSTGKLILFGGQSADVFFNDTWVFDVDSRVWSNLDTSTGPEPSPRYGLPAVIDESGKFIISHGFTFEGRFDDTWSLDLSTNVWTDVSPPADANRPLKRCLHEMVWDRDARRILLYGGCSSGFGPCPQGDFWAFDPTTREWSELTPGEGPVARSNPALTYDKKAKRAILVGGLTESGYSSEVWQGTFRDDSFQWIAISPDGTGPAPRASHDIAFVRGDVYLFGGTGDAGITGDLWKLSLE